MGLNGPDAILQFKRWLDWCCSRIEPHIDLEKRVPHAIQVIRTGDAIQYANLVLKSGWASPQIFVPAFTVTLPVSYTFSLQSNGVRNAAATQS